MERCFLDRILKGFINCHDKKMKEGEEESLMHRHYYVE